MTPATLAARLEERQIPVYLLGLLVGIAVGAVAPGLGGPLEVAIFPVLGALLFVTFLQVPFTAVRSAFSDGRFLATILAVNFLVVPPIAFGLAKLAPGGDAVELGVLMVLLTPCIDYVIVFCRLAGGSDRRLLAAAPLLMLAQMVLLPLYLLLFLGSTVGDVVEPGPFVEAFLILIVLPLGLAWATEAWSHRSPRGERVKDAADLTPVALMALTLLVVVASQWPRVQDDLDDVVGVVPIFALFLVVMAVVGWTVARTGRFDAASGRAIVFSGATRNSLVVLPLALALPDAYALTATIVVTQTIVELVGMVVYVRLIPRIIQSHDR